MSLETGPPGLRALPVRSRLAGQSTTGGPDALRGLPGTATSPGSFLAGVSPASPWVIRRYSSLAGGASAACRDTWMRHD